MSKFKVGDWVRRISNGEQRQVSDVDMSDGTFYSSADNLWYFQHNFELVSPQPAESPDDWVEITDPNHVPRVGIDWFEGPNRQWEVQAPHHVAYTVGYFANVSGGHKHYCRRRDYPQKLAEVHSGGPYVARSEYERVLAESAAKDKAIAELAEHIRQLDRMIHEPTPNGWPLVPVDPSCIPEGHRAVEVTKNTQGKFVASHSVHRFLEDHNYPRLVVEPIPTPQAPDALPRPEFPAWIRAGWWVAMDAGGFWYMSEDEPIATEPVLGSTADRGTWNPPNMDDIRLTHGVTASMKAVPCDRWREAKWQVE